MESIDTELEIDMEISEDERESKGTVVAQVVNSPEVEFSHVDQISADTDSNRKRKQSSFLETSPSVRIVYHNLSRESRKRLQDLLRRWSEWQGWHSQHYAVSRDDSIESGDEQYFPALQIGPTASRFSVSFWVDRPAKQARTNDAENTRNTFNTSSQERENEVDVPLYDRVTPSLSAQETRGDGYVEHEREAARCFNCGSYSHALRDCHRPRNYEAINSARSNFNHKKGFQSAPRSAPRYYQSPSGSDDLKPVVLGSEMRQLFGVGDNDLLPQTHRMQVLDTPSDYLGGGDEAIKEESGTNDKDEKENKTRNNEEGEEGEIVDDVEPPVAEELYIAFSNTDPDFQEHKMTAEFTEMNSPMPEHTGEHLWRQGTQTYVPGHSRSSHYQRSISMQTARAPTYGSPVLGPYIASPQRVWEGRNLHHSDYISTGWDAGAPRAPASTPINIPVNKKDDDDWDLNFESTVYRSESSRPSSGLQGVIGGYYDIARQGLTVNTAIGFSPTEASLLSPTGSGYGESFRPSSGHDLPSPTPDSRNGTSTPPLPSQVSQHFESVQRSVTYQQSSQSTHVADPQPSQAWAQAQAALSSLQTRQKVDGHSRYPTHQGR